MSSNIKRQVADVIELTGSVGSDDYEMTLVIFDTYEHEPSVITILNRVEWYDDGTEGPRLSSRLVRQTAELDAYHDLDEIRSMLESESDPEPARVTAILERALAYGEYLRLSE